MSKLYVNLSELAQDPARLRRRVKKWRRDFPLFAREVLVIQTKRARMEPFVLNRAQLRVWAEIKECLDAGRPIRFYILKARQMGMSTMIQGLAYWYTTLHKNRNALVVSHDSQSAETLLQKSVTFYHQSPKALQPHQKKSNRRELVFGRDPDPRNPDDTDTGLQSKIVVQVAENPHLGASLTLHFVHLSEFARYENIQKNVHLSFTTLMEAVPMDMPDSFVFIETTAWGLGYGKDFWDKTNPAHEEHNGFKGIFLSWVADPTYTVSSTNLEDIDLDDRIDGPFGNEVQAIDIVKAELRYWYPDESEDPEWVEAEALRRMDWRRKKISLGDLDLFRQENPLFPEEAFLTSGNAVFDTRKLHDIMEALTALNDEGQVVYPETRYRLDHQVGKFYRALRGNLSVYHEPKAGQRYVIGADVSEGIAKGDYSAVQVLSVPQLEQVAVWHGRVAPDDLAVVVAALGRLYNDAFVAVEVNGPGYATNLELHKRLKYRNLYRREILDAKTRTFQKRYGWQTNKATKHAMITELRSGVATDLIRFRHPETLREMSVYIQDDSGKTCAAPGERDDLVMSLALALQMYVQGNYGSLKQVVNNSPPPGSPLFHQQQMERQRYAKSRIGWDRLQGYS